MPELKPSSRSREYNLYKEIQRARVVQGWLFQGKTHRELDEEVLGLDPHVSQGWQSMGILHFLGLKKDFRGLFRDVSKKVAVKVLRDNEQDFVEIIHYINSVES